MQFSVEGVSCAITVGKTVFVERMVRIIPQSERGCGVSGVVDIHGRMVPVYPVRKLLGFADRKPRLSDVLIVTKAGSDCVALWVDETSGISSDAGLLREEASAPAGEPGVRSVTISPDGLVIIRDLADFLKNPQPEKFRAVIPAVKIIFRDEDGERLKG